MEAKNLVEENETLTRERDDLLKKYKEANDIVEAIKNGGVDAILLSKNSTSKVLTDKNADFSYRRFIENMSEGVVTLQPNGIIVFCNSSFAKMVNTPLEKVIGTNFRKYIPLHHTTKFELFFDGYGDTGSKLEICFLDSYDNCTYVDISFNKLQFLDSVSLNLVCVDVTEQKLAKEKLMEVNAELKSANDKLTSSERKVLQLNGMLKANVKILEKANKELSAFGHIASHDLQEPLRKIMTYCSVLIRDYHDVINQQGQAYMSNMQNASKRMKDLINNISEFSYLSTKDFSFKTIDLQTVVNESLSNLKMIIEETQATITIENQLPEIEANSVQLMQLFNNVFTNALKFTKAGTLPILNLSSKIVMGNELDMLEESRFDERFCVIYVRDNGIGFDPVYKNKIFAIFQRLNSNHYYKGSGMGLAICKKIVEQHKGFITADSKLAEGALFTIILPVSQPTEIINEPA